MKNLIFLLSLIFLFLLLSPSLSQVITTVSANLVYVFNNNLTGTSYPSTKSLTITTGFVGNGLFVNGTEAAISNLDYMSKARINLSQPFNLSIDYKQDAGTIASIQFLDGLSYRLCHITNGDATVSGILTNNSVCYKKEDSDPIDNGEVTPIDLGGGWFRSTWSNISFLGMGMSYMSINKQSGSGVDIVFDNINITYLNGTSVLRIDFDT